MSTPGFIGAGQYYYLMVVTINKTNLDRDCKLPHAFVNGTDSIVVGCKKGIVDLKDVSNKVNGSIYLDGMSYQKITFKWYKIADFCSKIEESTILYVHPDVPLFLKKKREERAREIVLKTEISKKKKELERKKEILEKKRKIAEKFQVERNTCLIAGELYQYQNDGVIFMQINRNVILADDMGLGKTIETIEFLLREKRDGLFSKALIVVPASLKVQWKQEIERFAGNRFSIVIVDGTKDKRSLQWQGNADIFISNYDSLVNDGEYGFLDTMTFSHMIVDEASFIKNYAAKRTVALKKIGKNVKCKMALTGTPLENDVDELWSIADFVNPKLFGSRDDFKNHYKYLKGNGHSKHWVSEKGWPHKVSPDDYRKVKIKEIRDKLKLVMIRRRKSEVLTQLPPLVKMRETVDLDAPARALHDTMFVQMKDLIHEFMSVVKRQGQSEEAAARMKQLMNMIRTKFVYLRELCLMPELIITDEPVVNVKLERLKEIVGDISEGNKIVVFTEFRRVALELNKKIPNSLIVHGQIDKMKRPAIIEEFKNSPDKNVLITTNVLTYGVNLQFANYIINYDLHFNPAKMSQRTDRLHRIGQTRGVTVMNIIANNSIEERVEQILVRKHDMFCEVIEGKSVDPNFLDKSLLFALAEVMDE